MTHVCVVDGGGAITWRGVCATDPEVLAKTLVRHARDLKRAVLETGALSDAGNIATEGQIGRSRLFCRGKPRRYLG